MTKQIDWKNTLSKTYLFQSLAENELSLVQQIAEARTYSRGEHLFSQNDEPDAIYVIRYGSVKSEAFGPEKAIMNTAMAFWVPDRFWVKRHFSPSRLAPRMRWLLKMSKQSGSRFPP